MRQWLLIAVIGLCFFSCKKEISLSIGQTVISDDSFFKNVQSKLKDSLSNNDFKSIDESRWYTSKDVQSNNYFVRIAFVGKKSASDFILLKTDSSGNISEGKIIHVDKVNDVNNKSDILFRGQFKISSLNRITSVVKEVENGRSKKPSNSSSLLEEEPAGTQDLPEVVVTTYSYDGGYTGDWYWYGGFYDDYDYSSSGGEYTYGSSTGGGSASSTTTTTDHNDNTMNIEVEPNDDAPIKVKDYTACFSTVTDANASYQITIYSDIPVDGQPSEMFNWSTGSPGHSFIQLSKSSGGITVQQNFGFYPKVGWKTLGPYPTESKVVDNGGHEYNASLTQSINSSQFQAKVSRMEAIQDVDYDITGWNCTNFALDIFNTAAASPLPIQEYITDSGEPMETPQGLYTEIQNLQNSGNTTYGTPSVPKAEQHAGASHGNCND